MSECWSGFDLWVVKKSEIGFFAEREKRVLVVWGKEGFVRVLEKMEMVW